MNDAPTLTVGLLYHIYFSPDGRSVRDPELKRALRLPDGEREPAVLAYWLRRAAQRVKEQFGKPAEICFCHPTLEKLVEAVHKRGLMDIPFAVYFDPHPSIVLQPNQFWIGVAGERKEMAS